MRRRWIVAGMLAAAACAVVSSGALLSALTRAGDARSGKNPGAEMTGQSRGSAGSVSGETVSAEIVSTAGPVIRIPSYPLALPVGQVGREGEIRLCQYFSGGEACARPFTGVDCQNCNPCGEADWTNMRQIPWEFFAQGEYVGPHRPQHVPEYRLRVDDEIDFVYRLTRVESPHPYELNVGDKIRVESLTDANLDRELVIQPDGTITLRLLGQVRAARRTVDELRQALEESYKKYYKVPAITVTPVEVNTKLEDLRASVDGRFGAGGQNRQARVTPEGTVQLPAIGSIPAQGLTLEELKHEVDERYAAVVDGIEVTPVLLARAPRFVFVVGEVRTPNRYELTGPTTLMGAISLAGGWNHGGNLREVVVFRRAEDWRLIATKIDIQGALWGKRPCPADEIWLRDSDIVVVPKSPILRFDDFVDLYFTRGLYGLFPVSGSFSISRATQL